MPEVLVPAFLAQDDESLMKSQPRYLGLVGAALGYELNFVAVAQTLEHALAVIDAVDQYIFTIAFLDANLEQDYLIKGLDGKRMLNRLQEVRPEVVTVGMSSEYPFPSAGGRRVNFDLSGGSSSEWKDRLGPALQLAASR